MTSKTSALLVMLTTASSLAAQSSVPVRAFPRSAGASFGVASFDTRSQSLGAKFTYKSSLTVGGRLDQPLSRRTGLLLNAAVAPLTQQKGEGTGSTVLSNKLIIGVVDAGIGFRFKPSAPVFFLAGGGLTYATRPPVPESTGSVAEPHGVIAIGYDARSTDAWSIRTVFTSRIVIPGDDNDALSEASSFATDWGIEVGGRYTFGKRTGR